MRASICRKRVLVKWLSANCRMKYRACRMRRPPVLNRRCWRLVRDQLWMATGKTSRRSRLPRLWVAGEARPVGGFLAFLDPLLGRPALVVEADDRSVRPRERGDD